MDLQHMLSTRGSNLLTLNLFKYRKVKVLKSGETFWTCTNKYCRAKVFTVGCENTVTRSVLEHNHNSDEKKLNRQKICASVKKKVDEDMSQSPSTIIHSVINDNVDSVNIVCSNDITLLRNTLSQHKRKVQSQLSKSKIDDVHAISNDMESFKTAIREEEWLLVNNGMHKKHYALPNTIEYADVDIKPEIITESYCDQSYIPESPARCEESLQEPSTSILVPGPPSTPTPPDCSPPKRKRNEIDVSRMISSISSDIRNLMERSGTTNDSHFCHSIAFEIEKMDEDSRDLTKAAIWQVIYKVKSAKKKNIELTLEDMFK